jgi:hypothetical protein
LIGCFGVLNLLVMVGWAAALADLFLASQITKKLSIVTISTNSDFPSGNALRTKVLWN